MANTLNDIKKEIENGQFNYYSALIILAKHEVPTQLEKRDKAERAVFKRHNMPDKLAETLLEKDDDLQRRNARIARLEEFVHSIRPWDEAIRNIDYSTLNSVESCQRMITFFKNNINHIHEAVNTALLEEKQAQTKFAPSKHSFFRRLPGQSTINTLIQLRENLRELETFLDSTWEKCYGGHTKATLKK